MAVEDLRKLVLSGRHRYMRQTNSEVVLSLCERETVFQKVAMVTVWLPVSRNTLALFRQASGSDEFTCSLPRTAARGDGPAMPRSDP